MSFSAVIDWDVIWLLAEVSPFPSFSSSYSKPLQAGKVNIIMIRCLFSLYQCRLYTESIKKERKGGEKCRTNTMPYCLQKNIKLWKHGNNYTSMNNLRPRTIKKLDPPWGYTGLPVIRAVFKAIFFKLGGGGGGSLRPFKGSPSSHTSRGPLDHRSSDVRTTKQILFWG